MGCVERRRLSSELPELLLVVDSVLLWDLGAINLLAGRAPLIVDGCH